MYVTLYETREVRFCLFGANGFHLKAENGNFIAAGLRGRQNLKNMKISHCPLADYFKNCTKNRAARAARLFFLVQIIKSLICGVVVVIAVVISQTP